MSPAGTTLSDPTSAPFPVAAERAIRSTQRAFAELIEGAGLEGARAVDLARSLSLDKTLAWKISRFTLGDDPCAAFKHLPGPGGVEIVVKAAQSRGVGEPRLEAARNAHAELSAFVRRHAGDRRSFEAMLAGARRDPRAEAEERKAFYQAGAAIWGVRASAQLLTLAIRPSESDANALDCVSLSGFVDLERLRPDVSWVLRRLRVHNDDGSLSTSFRREPLDPQGAAVPEGGQRPLSLMPDYCSKPLPRIRQRIGASGWLYDELAPGQVGRRGAVTVISGERYLSALPRLRSEDNTEGRYILTVRTPVEHVQFDLLLHEDLTNFRWPTRSVIGNLEERISSERVEGRELMPDRPAETVDLGALQSAGRVPMSGRLLADGLARAGWGSPAAFRHYRVALDHPPAPCEIVLTAELTDS